MGSKQFKFIKSQTQGTNFKQKQCSGHMWVVFPLCAMFTIRKISPNEETGQFEL